MSLSIALLGMSLVLLALVAGLRAVHLRREAGLPYGRLLYADTGERERPRHALFSVRHQLVGRPDYLVEQSGCAIPVEVKSRACPSSPYPSHQLQLAAYCLLVEDTLGQSPPYGILKYADGAVRVSYTPSLRARLLDTLQDMRRDCCAQSVSRNHNSRGRCRACGFRSRCEESLS